MFRSIFRATYVFLRLLPFAISFVRDFRRWGFFGEPMPRSREQHAARARDLTRLVAQLGPTFIKGVQVLGVREDIIPDTYTAEFKTLQDRVPPFPSAQALATIERELGRPASELFDEFEHEPMAAASLGQVHGARIHGQRVAVKVLRPDIERLVATDLAVVTFILGFIGLFGDSSMLRSAHAIHREFSRVIGEEMDYKNELLNAGRLRANFAEDPRVVIPDAFPELSSHRVVTFVFCEGSRIDDLAALHARNIDSRAILELLAETYLRMVVLHGFLHADPHPGNIIVMDGGRIALVDFGMAIEIEPETREEMLNLVKNVISRNIDGVVETFYKLKAVEPETNRAILCDAAETLMKIRLSSSFSPRRIQEVALEVLRTFHNFPLRMPEQLVYLARAAALIEGIGYEYDPKFNAVLFATPIVRRLLKERPEAPQQPFLDRLLGGGREVMAIAREFARAIHRIERDDLRFRVHQADMQHLESFLVGALRRILVAIGAVGIALWGATLYERTGHIIILISTGALAFIMLSGTVLVPRRRSAGRKIPWL